MLRIGRTRLQAIHIASMKIWNENIKIHRNIRNKPYSKYEIKPRKYFPFIFIFQVIQKYNEKALSQ